MRRVILMLAALLGLAPGAQAAVPAEAWNLYRQKFVTAEGRVVDDANGGISHSESQGYGLLLACLAGDRATFASIFASSARNFGSATMDWPPGAGTRRRARTSPTSTTPAMEIC